MQVSPVEPVADPAPVEENKEAEINPNHEIIVRRKKKDTRHFKKKVFEPLKPKETPKDEVSSFNKLDQIFLSKENVRKNTNEPVERDFTVVKDSQARPGKVFVKPKQQKPDA